MSKVAVLKTTPETVVNDYGKLMQLAEYKKAIKKTKETILKLNLSWSMYYPACSTEPWQLEGTIKQLQKDGFSNLHPVENKTVVTDVWKGAKGNKWLPLLKKYNLKYEPLTEVEWVRYVPKAEMLAFDSIFPDGHRIPKMFLDKNVIHFPTVKCTHPDTEVMQSDGTLMTIKEMVEEVHEKNTVRITKDQDRVAIANHDIPTILENGKIKTNKAREFWKTPAPKEIYKIKTKTGREVKVSEVHPFLTQEGWIPAKELKNTHRIAIPRKITIKGKSQKLPKIKTLNHKEINIEEIKFKETKKLKVEEQKDILKDYLKREKIKDLAKKYSCDRGTIRRILKRYGVQLYGQEKKDIKIPSHTSKEFCRWLGYFIAEGHVVHANKRSYQFCLTNSNNKIQKDYIELTKNLFNITPKIYKGNKIQLIFTSKKIAELFLKIGLEVPSHAGNKLIPRLIFKCKDKEILEFLNGYIDGDGHIDKDGNLCIKTKSTKLSKDVQLILTRLGVIASVSKTRNKVKETEREYDLIIVSGESMRVLGKKISLRIASKQDRIREFLKRKGSSPNWDSIPLEGKKIKEIREGLKLKKREIGNRTTIFDIEEERHKPSRKTVKGILEGFEKRDKEKRYSREIKYIKFLASEDIAWDHIKEIKREKSDTEFLYDFTVPGPNNFIGNGIVLHNTHGHTVTTGSIKNAFGGLITERRHHCHAKIHEVLVDLLQIQKEIHPGMFAVMDGTVCGNGAGPRTMEPVIKNVILAAQDQVAIDAVAAKMMGFDPMKIKYLKLAHDLGLGCADIKQIEVVGEDIKEVNFKFTTKKSPVVAADQLTRKGALSAIEPILFHSPLFKACVFGSAFYHDHIWYNTVGRKKINTFMQTEWGKLWQSYE